MSAASPSVPEACAAGEHWFYRPVRCHPSDPLPVGVPDCERPRRFTCRRCGYFFIAPCEGSDPSRCLPCAGRYRTRVQVVARGPALVARPGTLLFVTLTAPGARPHCVVPGCSGSGAGPDGATAGRGSVEDATADPVPAPGCRHERCPCTGPAGTDVASWNARQGEAWTHLLRDLRLLLGGFEYFRAVEVQDRGALHLHLLVRVAAPVLVGRELLRDVRALALRHGFGHSVDVQSVGGDTARSARLVAWYLAKYVGKAAGARREVPWRRRVCREVDLVTGEVRVRFVGPCGYRTWTASRRWGSSMGAVKAAQRAWGVRHFLSDVGAGLVESLVPELVHGPAPG